MHAMPSGEVTVSKTAMAGVVPAEMAATMAAAMPSTMSATMAAAMPSTMSATMAAAFRERAGCGGERERGSQDDRTRSNSAR
jgi:hypothetical protein